MKKKKWFIISGLLIPITIIVAAVGYKYFPLNKVVSIPSTSETEFTDNRQVSTLPPHSLYFNFEIVSGKNTPDGFYKGIAHSGQYSAKAYGQNSFGAAIEREVKEIGLENLGSVSLSTWVYVFPTTKEVNAAFVFSASNEMGVNVCWKGVNLSGPGIPRGKWFKISGNFDLSDVKFKPDYKVKIYFWNNSSTDILVDDYYMVFGSFPERRGDSTLVDMTNGATYIPKFNTPPYKTYNLENVKSLKKIPKIEVSDQVLQGNFLEESSGMDEFIVIRPGVRPYLLTICPGSDEIKKIAFSGSTEELAFLNSGKISIGKFISGRTDQVLILTPKEIVLGRFSGHETSCSTAASPGISFQLIWRSDLRQLSRFDVPDKNRFFAADYNADGICELLLISNQGYWKVLQLDQAKKNSWKIIAGSDKDRIQEWDNQIYQIGINTGRFLAPINKDVILTVVKNLKTGKPDYSLRILNETSGNFESLFSEKQNFFGKTYGPDTLKPTDRFIVMRDDQVGKKILLRYNREWRFDLKQMRFNDSTFQIMGNIDFHGFEKDYNPKYYEYLRIFSGKFLNSTSLTLFIIGMNESKTKDLPDCMEFYSLPQTFSE